MNLFKIEQRCASVCATLNLASGLGGSDMADHATPKELEENVRQITDSSWKSALRAAMRVLEEPKHLKAERLAAVRRGIEETVKKFGDQHPRQKDKMISWGKLQIQLIEDFVTEIESGGTPGGGND